MNQFSDLTQAEFEARHMGGYKPSPSSSAVAGKRSAFASTFNITRQLPESVDWREKVSWELGLVSWPQYSSLIGPQS